MVVHRLWPREALAEHVEDSIGMLLERLFDFRLALFIVRIIPKRVDRIFDKLVKAHRDESVNLRIRLWPGSIAAKQVAKGELKAAWPLSSAGVAQAFMCPSYPLFSRFGMVLLVVPCG